MEFLTSRFLAAVSICSGELAIKQRLASAWMEHLDDINADDLPPSQRQTFVELRNAMYARKPLPDESAPCASIRKMSTQQVASYTNLIVAIYAGLLSFENRLAFADDQPGTGVAPGGATPAEDRTRQRLN